MYLILDRAVGSFTFNRAKRYPHNYVNYIHEGLGVGVYVLDGCRLPDISSVVWGYPVPTLVTYLCMLKLYVSIFDVICFGRFVKCTRQRAKFTAPLLLRQ